MFCEPKVNKLVNTHFTGIQVIRTKHGQWGPSNSYRDGKWEFTEFMELTPVGYVFGIMESRSDRPTDRRRGQNL